MLPPLPYDAWEPTKTTLHLWAQIVGKIELGSTAHRNHWWNITLLPSARGLRTHRMTRGGTGFDVEFDFIDHRLVIRSDGAHEPAGFELRDGLSVAEFYRSIFEELRKFGIEMKILSKPYGVPMTTPFERDEEHRSYDNVMVRRFWEVLSWSAGALQTFASRFEGKQSPVHIYWHTFDLAMSRFSGKRADTSMRPDRVQKEAYSHEVIAFGFWAGDANTPAPTYYTYTAPEPVALAQQPLLPQEAAWFEVPGGHLGGLRYDAVRTAEDPLATLLSFYQSGYDAGVKTANWDTSGFDPLVIAPTLSSWSEAQGALGGQSASTALTT